MATQEPTLAEVNQKIDKIDTTLNEVIKMVKMVYTDTQGMKKDISSLDTRVSSLEKGQENLEKGQEKLEKGQKNLEQGQKKIVEILQVQNDKLIRLESFQENYNDRFNDLKYEVRKDSEKLDRVYDERKLVIHKFGLMWGAASFMISLASLTIAKVFFY